MFRNTNGKNKAAGCKELGVNRIGRKPAINAESNAAGSSLVVFFAMRYIKIVSNAKRTLGIIFAAISSGMKRLKKAMT